MVSCMGPATEPDFQVLAHLQLVKDMIHIPLLSYLLSTHSLPFPSYARVVFQLGILQSPI